MTGAAGKRCLTVPSDMKVIITVKNIPYDKDKHYKLGQQLGQFVFNSTTGGFWRGLAEYVIEEETKEAKPSAGAGWHKGMGER